MNRTRILISSLAMVAILGTGAGYYAFSRARPNPVPADPTASPQSEAAVRLAVIAPLRKTLRRVTTQPGRIEAFEKTLIFVKLPGYLQKISVDIGDHVEADQPLAELWIPELEDEARQKEALVANAEAGVEQARAAVRAAEAGEQTARATVQEAQAGTIRAQGQYERWKSQYARIVELAANQAVDRKLVDETKNELSAAEAARGEAQAKVAVAEATLTQRRADIDKAKADLAVSQASLGSSKADLARVQSLLQYRQVRMPYAGTVTERNVNRGDFVSPANTSAVKPLFVVARSDAARIFVDVPEMEAPLVRRGAKGNVFVQALPTAKIEGTIARTSWALGPNRTLRTELDIPNPNGLLQPGMYATVEILLEEHRDVVALPLSAVIRAGQQAFCYCVENGRAVRKPLSLGMETSQDVEVRSGLAGQERVIQAPPPSLQEGQSVEET